MKVGQLLWGRLPRKCEKCHYSLWPQNRSWLRNLILSYVEACKYRFSNSPPNAEYATFPSLGRQINQSSPSSSVSSPPPHHFHLPLRHRFHYSHAQSRIPP